MHLSVLGAALQGGDDLARVEQAFGVEGALDGEHLLAFFGRKLHAHAAELFDAHAVLAGDGAAHLHAGLEDVGAKQLGAVQLIAVVGVKQDQRMQVAIAGMKDIAATQLVLLFHLGDGQQDVSQALARDGRIMHM